jgi:hypothetical protein
MSIQHEMLAQTVAAHRHRLAVDRVLLCPWYLRWGATNDEFRKHLAR